MKKFYFPVIAVLLALAIFSCDGMGSSSKLDDEIFGFIDVEYSPDGRFVTIYLEGGVPETTASRALNTDLAKMGHDFFEVVFVYDADGTAGNEIVARASWELGQAVGIRGVYRTATGINYGTVSGHLTPTIGAGSAILFVGRKADKTLLAVGDLAFVDGLPASGTNLITSETRNVTFSVAALDAGVSLNITPPALPADPPLSSFLTAADDVAVPATPNPATDYKTVAAANTLVYTRKIGDKVFPIFELPKEVPQVNAQYTVEAVEGIAKYLNGIRLVNVGRFQSSVSKREPRYPAGGGLYWYVEGSFLCQNTKVTITNNLGVNAAFSNVITFSFDTRGSAQSIFAFNFDIPVYAIFNNDSAAELVTGPAGEIWRIRPGYGTNVADLDDGEGGAGGAILLGTDVNELDAILVTTTPFIPYL